MWPRLGLKSNHINQSKGKNNIKRQISEESISIRGIWYATFGRLVMIQRGNKVTGYYSWNDGIVNGELTENVLLGTWNEELLYPSRKNYGNIELTFTENEFSGKWGYGNEPLRYTWEGLKASSNFEDKNCYRYRVLNESPYLSDLYIGNEIIGYKETSAYFYPQNCLPILDLNLIISHQLISRKISVNPGYSYTFSVRGIMPYVVIDTLIDNPF